MLLLHLEAPEKNVPAILFNKYAVYELSNSFDLLG